MKPTTIKYIEKVTESLLDVTHTLEQTCSLV